MTPRRTTRVKPLPNPLSMADKTLNIANYISVLRNSFGDFSTTDVQIPPENKFSIGIRDISTTADAIEVYTRTSTLRYSAALVQFFGDNKYKFIVHSLPVKRTGIPVTPEEVVEVLNKVFLTPLFPEYSFSYDDGVLCCRTLQGVIPTKAFHPKQPMPFPLFHADPIVDSPTTIPLRGPRVQEQVRWNKRYIATPESESGPGDITLSSRHARESKERVRPMEAAFNPDSDFPEV